MFKKRNDSNNYRRLVRSFDAAPLRSVLCGALAVFCLMLRAKADMWRDTDEAQATAIQALEDELQSTNEFAEHVRQNT